MVTASGNETLYQLAQQLLGDGRLWTELQVAGVSDPNAVVPDGTVVYAPEESPGPPGAPMVVNTWQELGFGTQPTSQYAPDVAPWTALDPHVRDQISGLAFKLETNSGFRITPNQGDLINMANLGIDTLYGMSQYMVNNGEWGHAKDQFDAMPWLAFGLDHDQFNQYTETYASMVQEMTGLAPSPADIARALQSSKGQFDPSYWKQQFMQDDNNRKKFGWIKYGMKYQEFQAFRDTQERKFGRKLTDAEGAAWLDETKTEEAAPPQGQKEIIAQPQPQKKETPQMSAIR